jgi:hypothetical protein
MSPRRVLTVTLVSVAVVGLVAAGTGFALADPQQDSPSDPLIKSAFNSRCLVMPGTGNGTRIQVTGCDESKKSQLFQLQSVAGTGGYQIQVENGSGKCIDADTTSAPANGTIVQVWDCNGQDQQLWDLAPGVTLLGGVVLVNRYASEVAGHLVVLDLDSTGGRSLQLWAYNGGSNQVWQGVNLQLLDYIYHPRTNDGVQPPRNTATGTIGSLSSGRCLDAKDAQSASNGGRVQMYTCHGHANQQWKWGSGYTGGMHQITLANGMCLDADATTIPQNGTKVQVWSCNLSVQQTWTPVRLGNGYLMVNDGATKALGRLVVLQANGSIAQLWQYDDTGPAAQLWQGDELDTCYFWTLTC